MAVFLLACACASSLPAQEGHHVLVLGRISDDPQAHYDQLKPLLDYVVPRMADLGIREGRILMAGDAQQMQSYLRRGRVDWVTETSGNGMLLKERARAEPLLITERDGVSRYHTIYFARRDSGIRDIDDLRGRSIAFQNRASTSAYYIPAIELLAAGLSMEVLLSPMDRSSSTGVGYLFARSELNLSSWVHKGLVDAGVMSNLDWDNVQRVPLSFRRDFVVFRETAPYPRALEVVRGDMDARVKQRLRELLLAAHEDPAARDALSSFFRTTRFIDIDAQARRELDQMGKGVARVVAEVE